MKKMTFLACAALLASAVALTSCNNEEPQKQNEVVKTQFAISLPQQLAPKGVNHMPSSSVQRDGLTQFQGMTGITLVPFAKQGEILSTDERLGTNITAGLTDGVFSGSSHDIDRPSRATVFEDVSIPLATASFLFYAKSAAQNGTKEAAERTPAEKFAAGSLIWTGSTSTTPADFKFDLEKIQADGSALTVASAAGGKLIAYLTSIAVAKDAVDGKKWCNYLPADNAAMKAMFDTYSSMHGLSSFEVSRVLSDLYKSLMPLSLPIATAIKDSIDNATYATVNTTTGEVTLIAELNSFPQSFNLPEGSVDIKWNQGAERFEDGTYSGMAALNTYVYPAQLWYYVNSTIKTSNQSQKTAYDNSNDWAAILARHTDATSVNSRTRAVAVKDSIQYAVARLDIQARLTSASLADNSESAVGIATAVDCSAGFPISAVLVGGQQQVNFDFTSTAAGTEFTIYDTVMDPASTLKAMPGDAYSAMNHTLVLENGTADVMIALEMTNTTGVDFYGVGNQLIAKNSKFYVVGKLLAAQATQTSGHVFKQDYTTTAKLKLTNLQKAYNTLPDLRTPQLELGFSVDLSWKSGHTYEIELDE